MSTATTQTAQPRLRVRYREDVVPALRDTRALS